MVNEHQGRHRSKQVIEVEYRMNGDATAYSSEARISAVDPFFK
jgi:hypothetical protein